MMADFQPSAMARMIDTDFRLARRYDLSASFIDVQPHKAVHELRAVPGVHLAEGTRSVAVRLRSENRMSLTRIIGLPAGGQLQQLVNTRLQAVPLPEQGLVINDYLARQLRVGVGDWLWVEVMEGRRQHLRLPIARLTQSYLGIDAYMELSALNHALGDGHVINGALLTAERERFTAIQQILNQRPHVASAETRLAGSRAFFETTAQTGNIFTWIAVLMGSVINFGVVYNSARIALAERSRELASMRVLGFTQGEVGYILLGEQALLVLASIPLGLVAGYGLSWMLAHGMQSDLYRVPIVLSPSSYAFSALVTVGSAIVSSLAIYWRIRQLDLIGVLKTRE